VDVRRRPHDVLAGDIIAARLEHGNHSSRGGVTVNGISVGDQPSGLRVSGPRVKLSPLSTIDSE
jgi:hypothetical protein